MIIVLSFRPPRPLVVSLLDRRKAMIRVRDQYGEGKVSICSHDTIGNNDNFPSNFVVVKDLGCSDLEVSRVHYVFAKYLKVSVSLTVCKKYGISSTIIKYA